MASESRGVRVGPPQGGGREEPPPPPAMAAIRRHTQSRAPPSLWSPAARPAGRHVEENVAQPEGVDMHSIVTRFSWLVVTVTLALLLAQPTFVAAAPNPLCPGEDVFFNPGNGEDIIVPPGFKVSVFKSGLNFPTAVPFRGNSRRFRRVLFRTGTRLARTRH